MKKLKKTEALAKNLRLSTESIKLLTEGKLDEVRGGAAHTSFSCGRDLCTTH